MPASHFAPGDTLPLSAQSHSPASEPQQDRFEWVGSYGGILLAVDVKDTIVYVGEGTGLKIMDVQDPSNPRFLAHLPIPGMVKAIQVTGDYAYIAAGTAGFYILDVQNPTKPTLLSNYATGRDYIALQVVGNIAYVTDWINGLHILDVSTPGPPILLGYYLIEGVALDIHVVGGIAYVAVRDKGLSILDVNNPAAPTLLGSYPTEDATLAVQVEESRAYLAAGDVHILNVQNPANPKLLGICDTSWEAADIQVMGSTMYIADSFAGFQIMDVQNPVNPTLLASYSTDGEAFAFQVKDSIAYVVDTYKGLLILDIQNPAVPLLRSYLTAGYAEAVEVVGNLAYVAADRAGLLILDIQNPSAPTLLGSLDTIGYARAIQIMGNLAYVADGGHIHIIDVQNPTTPTLLGSYETTRYTWSLQIVGSIAYVGDSSGLSILDVQNPANPTLLGSYATEVSVDSIQIVGNTAYILAGNVDILNVQEPSTPTLLGSYNTIYGQSIQVVGSIAYVASWKEGIHILDVSDPTNPILLNTYDTDGESYALQFLGNTVYVADGSAGIHILDVSDPINPVLLSSYDTVGSTSVLQVVGNTAYLADGSTGMQILHINLSPLSRVTITGPSTATTNKTLTFTAKVDPVDVAYPIEYAWSPPPVNRQGTTVATYRWQQTGDKQIEVTASNRDGSVSTRHTIQLSIPLSNVTISGPMTATVKETTTFTATIDPPDVAQPVEYTWSPEPTHGQGTAVSTYHWQQSGSRQIGVTASNPFGSVAGSQTILVEDAAEPNDTCAQGNPIIPDGTIQSHDFYQGGDVDWVSFDAIANTTYLVEAQVPAESRADVALEVYGDCTGDPDASQDHTFAPGVRIQFEAPAAGPIWLKLSNHDPLVAGGDVTYNLSVRELGKSAKTGALIIVAGRLKVADTLQANIHQVASQVRETFIPYGYTDEHITLLATDATLEGFDATPTVANLQHAITEWAVERVDTERALTLYLVDHGDKDTFYLDAPNSEELTPQQLNDWLDVVRQQRPDTRINVIIDTCYAGSFIDPQQTISTSGTVVIASTAADKLAWASQQGAVFSDYFLGGVRQGRSLYDSFTEARWAIQDGGYPQEPWLDDNGNGLHNDFTDGQEAQRRGFAYAGTLDDGSTLPDLDEWQPYIQQVEPVAVVHQEGIIRAKVVDNQQIDKVWAIVYKPSYRPPDSQSGMVSEELLPSPRLRKSSQSDVYEGLYDGFTETGTYTISVYAEDNRGLKARPVTVAVDVGPEQIEPLPLDEVLFLPLVVRD
jgi:hypothetical protein